MKAQQTTASTHGREPTLAELLARLERERARERGDRTIALFVAREAKA